MTKSIYEVGMPVSGPIHLTLYSKRPVVIVNAEEGMKVAASSIGVPLQLSQRRAGELELFVGSSWTTQAPGGPVIAYGVGRPGRPNHSAAAVSHLVARESQIAEAPICVELPSGSTIEVCGYAPEINGLGFDGTFVGRTRNVNQTLAQNVDTSAARPLAMSPV